MPDIGSYDNEDDWMAACVPKRLEEGEAQEQAVAVCLNMWREKAAGDAPTEKADTHRNAAKRALTELLTLLEDRTIPERLRAELEGARDALKRTWGDLASEASEIADQALAAEGALALPMLITKAERMKDGRIRWQARANTGEWDLERERFDGSFWDDVLHNFSRVQEATTKGEDIGLPVPILDVAHYSFRLPAEKRTLAQVGYPIKLWQDGRALMAQGYFCDTPLGVAAAKAAQSRPVEDRRVSIGVWPDWGRVELDTEGRRTYKGGRNRAYLDHLAMTGSPVDPGTLLEVKSMSQRQDAIDVLGEEAAGLIDELEAAKTKAMPDGALVKAECNCASARQPEQKAEEEPGEGEAEAPAETPAERSITLAELQDLLSKLFESFKSELDGRLGPVEAAVTSVEELKARVDALGASETEKVKAAVDSPGGEWWDRLVKNSVQRRSAPVEGQGPQQAVDASDPFYKVFGGLRPK